jgi:heat shock protein HspQ
VSAGAASLAVPCASVSDREPKFSPGQLVCHERFGYRGVIVDVDPVFSLSDDWYEEVARSRPPKDRPWYHVLVDDGDSTTYVAERHLTPDGNEAPIEHPMLGDFFTHFEDGRYVRGLH